MVVRIRLARFGKRNAPFYNIVVSQARSFSPPLLPPSVLQLTAPPPNRKARNSKPIEVLGTPLLLPPTSSRDKGQET